MLLASSASLTRSQAQTQTCIPSSDVFFLHWVDNCSYTEFLERLHDEMLKETPDCSHSATVELELLLGVSAAEAEALITNECQKKLDAQLTMSWKDVTQKAANGEPIFDQIYFNGGGIWNEQYQTSVENRVPYIPGEPSHVLAYDASRVDDVYESYAEEMKIEFPDGVVKNFDNCPLRAAMCCWVSDRQANDNNGNCATLYDTNCVNADPGDNTDLCYVDMERNPEAAGVDGGFAIYPGDNNNGEGAVHCHGMAWTNDPRSPESRYKGNNIFFVSMYDHLYTRGYVRNVPGAPMCGCIDTMPVVSRSDCTQVDVTELWVATYTPATDTTQASFELDLDPENGIQIEFNACQGVNNNNDLEDYYNRLVRDKEASVRELADVRKTLVGRSGGCNPKIDDFVASMGFGRTEA